jgi:predicted nucleic acid-binding protein
MASPVFGAHAIVLDASVAGAFIFKEPDRPGAKPVCDSIARGDLAAFVPELFWAELQNICLRKRDEKGLSQAAIEAAYTDAQRLPVVSQTLALTRYRADAWDLMRQVSGVGSYDFYYLALAIDLGIEVWTFDRRLRDAWSGSGSTMAGRVKVVGDDVVI